MDKKDRDCQVESFYRQEYKNLYRYVYQIVSNQDDSIEVVQETFLRFYRLQQEEQVRENGRALLFRLARNLAVDVLRRSQTRGSFSKEMQGGNLIRLVFTPTATPEEILLEQERRRLVELALTHLSNREQECLALRRCGLSYQEVAATLNLKPQSIGKIIARALRRFRGTYVELLENKEPSHKTRSAR